MTHSLGTSLLLCGRMVTRNGAYPMGKITIEENVVEAGMLKCGDAYLYGLLKYLKTKQNPIHLKA